MTSSNTADNSKRIPGKPFVKGDPRINRKGRPRSFDALRELAKDVVNKKIVSADRSVAMTRIQMILIDWAQSKDVRKQQALLDVAYGRVPQAVSLTGKEGNEIVIEITGKSDDDN